MTTESPINQAHVQWEGDAQLNAGQLSGQIHCRVLLSACPQKDLRIEVANEFGFAGLGLINEKAVSIELPGIPRPIDLLLLGFSTESDVIPFRVKKAPIISVKGSSLSRGKTLAVNFGPFWFPRHTSRFELEGDGWRVEFVPVCSELLSIRSELGSEEYRITHQVEFQRINGATFTPEDAEKFLNHLHLFLSFCHGRWVATSMSVCLDEKGKVVWEQWGTGKVAGVKIRLAGLMNTMGHLC